MKKVFVCNKKSLKDIPSTIGVYQFFNEKEVLYIGKSVNLRARIRSHFYNSKVDPKEALIIRSSKKIKFFFVCSEFDALLLEARLIRRFKPKFNKIWQDDKSYLYVKITIGDLYPRIFPVRKENDNQSLYFGPFSSLRLIYKLLREIRKVYHFHSTRIVPGRGCFYSKIGLCGPCPNLIEALDNKEEKDYQRKIYLYQINQIRKIFEGDGEAILNRLYKKLEFIKNKEEYEAAIDLRDEIFKLERFFTHRIVDHRLLNNNFSVKKALQSLSLLLRKYQLDVGSLNRIECYDVSSFSGKEAVGSMVVLSNGVVDRSQFRKFKIRAVNRNSDVDMLEEVIKRRFCNNWPRPDLVILDGGKGQLLRIKAFLEKVEPKIALVSLAKNPDRLMVSGDKISVVKLNYDNLGMNLLRIIRDESHRFARKYHLFLRDRNLLL